MEGESSGVQQAQEQGGQEQGDGGRTAHGDFLRRRGDPGRGYAVHLSGSWTVRRAGWVRFRYATRSEPHTPRPAPDPATS